MIISLIAAVSENNVIGLNNALLWHLPADMAYFRSKTLGHHVLMGRKNYESIPLKFRPLPDRVNIVVTRQMLKNGRSLYYVNDIKSGIEIAEENSEKELFIIGGGEIYRQSMALADRMYITRVHAKFDGDTYFPDISDGDWIKESETFRKSDEKNDFDMTFQVYTKK